MASCPPVGYAEPVTSAARKVLEEALSLPQEEREEIIGALSGSLEPVELSPEWKSEVARRMQKIDRGEAVFRDGPDHLRKLQTKYGG